MTKRLLLAILSCLLTASLFAQVYRNEWIDYSKTYYKFNIGQFGSDIVGAPIKSGVVRITQPTLAAAGLASIPAEQLQLWRNGEEVPIFISKSSGLLNPEDYIEFWGEINDGKLDKDLYRNPTYHLSDYFSITSDTAAYFLTTNTGANKRLTATANNVAQASIAPEKNFVYTVGRYFIADIIGGYAAVAAQNLYSSSYDRGEGYVSRPVKPNECGCGQRQLPQNFPALSLDTANGGFMTARISAVGNALNSRSVKLFLNADSITSFKMDYFFDAKISVPNLPANKIKNDTASFLVQNMSPSGSDELRVAKIELEYPRKFNFGNATTFRFNIAASNTGRFLKIYNFNKGTSTPVLYDLTNGKRYVADQAVADTLRFLLQPSTSDYALALVRDDGSTATTITAVKPRTFTDFSKPENQGNYIIISNPLLYGESGSTDFVEQYRAYRASSIGGGYNAKLIDINELTDQFAYGIKKHPLGIKNFLNYARKNFGSAPAYVFIIGKGVVYNEYKKGEKNAFEDQINLVPTFGNPGSDNMLSSETSSDAVPATPIGRLSAVSAKEVGDYLAKVKVYEQAQQDTVQSLEHKGWMKNVLQLAGANDPNLGVLLDVYQKKYRDIISDTIYGGIVTSFSKSSDPSAYPKAVASFKSIYEKGSGLVEYFGHSSATNLDFSLDDPSAYNNTGKYPMFIVNGCLAGNIFDNDPNRLTNRSTVSEKFVLEPQKGAIGYLSTSSFGVLNYLDIFTEKFFRSIGQTQYGQGFGNITRDGLASALAITGTTDFFGRIHAEQYTFHGDPALKVNSFPKADYAIETDQIDVVPPYVSVADDSFTIKVRILNLGKAVNDSVHFSLFRKFPNGDSLKVYERKFKFIKTIDSVTVKLPIVGNRDKGGILITAFVDDDNKVDELSEKNNIATKMFKISDEDVRPIFPYNYSIVNDNNITLSASTSDPLAPERNYVLELDTTALFNSPIKYTANKTSKGGLLEFENIALGLDQTVYYWRIAEASEDPLWTLFSFTHNAAANQGFEQAHYFQHERSGFDRISLDSTTRKFTFDNKLTNVFVQHSIYPTSGLENSQFSISVNGSYVTQSACVGSSIIFNVFDTLTFKPVENKTNPFGAGAVCDTTRKNNFEYSTQSAATRKNAADFFNSVPIGSYVIIRKIYDQGNADWASVWAKDTLTYGFNNSLYGKLKGQGLPIDSFNRPRTFVFIIKKDDSAHFAPISVFSQGLYDRISFTANMPTKETSGAVTSPKFGPAEKWNKVTWNGTSASKTNKLSINIIGSDYQGNDSTLYTLDSTQHEFDITSIDPAKYPYVKLRMNNDDTTAALPYQLQQWKVEYDPVPEGAIAPNLAITIPDTVTYHNGINLKYDTLQGYVVFKNVSKNNFTPLKLALTLDDNVHTPDTFFLPKTRALPAGDTLHVAFNINAQSYAAGTYNIKLQVNPNYDQPEQYAFNNTLYKYVTIVRDSATLPVRLVNFTAIQMAKQVQLQWVATNEINFSYYDVEHSINGKDFISIGKVQASNMVSVNKTYQLMHTNPVVGKNYYRLKMVDDNGRFLYSTIKTVLFGASAAMQVYPNPFFGKLKISVAKQENTPSTVRIYNSTGQQVAIKTFTGSTEIDGTSLAAGNYVVQVNDGSQTQSFKVHKQQ